MSDIYQDNTETALKKRYTISVLSEDRPGLLNRVTIIFTRRKLNIESINVSTSEVPGVSRYTLVVNTTKDQAEKVVNQIRKLIEVLGAFVYEEDEIYYQEIALYKVPTKIFLHGNKIENLVRSNNARILVIEEDYIVIEKTGHKHETQQLFNLLNEYGVLEFVRSGRVAISKSKRQTQHYLDELENSETHILNSNGQDKYGKN
ncbi:MAG: acetolactate synthase small subunit [Cyclobacteriaceae bacterium]|nr:acetolactate synthase small subunit [Cyclobacteriaceae bacterium]